MRDRYEDEGHPTLRKVGFLLVCAAVAVYLVNLECRVRTLEAERIDYNRHFGYDSRYPYEGNFGYLIECENRFSNLEKKVGIESPTNHFTNIKYRWAREVETIENVKTNEWRMY